MNEKDIKIRTLEQILAEYEHQLAEKDKEIADWKDGTMLLKIEKETRHQVCEEIRNFIKSNTVICGGQATREDMITSSAYNECLNDLRKCLDQIEQGESK